MRLPSQKLCSKDPLLNLFRQGDEREYFNTRKGANQRFLSRRRIHTALELMKKHLSKDTNSPVADMACGTATFGILLAEQGYFVDLIDNEPKFFEYIKNKVTHGKLNYIESDINKLSLDKKYFGIFFDEAIEHMSNPEETLKILRTKLLTGGLLCLTTPNGDFFKCKEPKWEEVKHLTKRNETLGDTIGNHVCEFGQKELVNLLRKSGFGLLEHKLINSHQISNRKIIRRLLPEGTLNALDSYWAKKRTKDGKSYGRIQIIVAQRFH